jgi:hypothetical protein
MVRVGAGEPHTRTALIVPAIVAPVHASAETTMRRGAGDVYVRGLVARSTVCVVCFLRRIAAVGHAPAGTRGRAATSTAVAVASPGLQ